MSGYQQVPQGQYPAYNPAYPQPPPYQPAPAYQPAYPPPSYPQQAAQPIVVNVTNNQNQQATQSTPIIAAPRVFLGRSYDNDVGPALIVFIIGWFTCFVWGAGFMFIRSKNRAAKMLGIASIVMFFSTIAIIVIAVSVSVAEANAAINSYNNNNYNSYSTTYTLYPSSMNSGYYSTGMSITVPYGYSTASISSYGSTWSSSAQPGNCGANGYTGTTCGSSCPMYYGNVMALVGTCGYSGSPVQLGSSYSSWYIGSCSTIYLAYNDATTNSHSGYLSVTVTWRS